MPETLSGAGDSLCERKGHSISTSIGGIATARVGGKFATGCQKLFWVQAITCVNGRASFAITAASTSLSATARVNGVSFYQNKYQDEPIATVRVGVVCNRMPETLSGAGDSLCGRKGHVRHHCRQYVPICDSSGERSIILSARYQDEPTATARVDGKFATGCWKPFQGRRRPVQMGNSQQDV